MVKHFLANLSFIVLLNVIIKPLYVLGIEVAVQNTVGATTWGLFFTLINTAYLLQIFNDFGLQIYNNRFVSLDKGHIASSFRGLLKFKLILSIVFISLLIGLTTALGYQQYFDLIIPIGINLILVSSVLFLRSYVSGLGFYKLDSILSVLDKVLLILLCGSLLLFDRESFTIYHFVYCQMISLAATMLTAVGILGYKHAFSGMSKEPVAIIPLVKKVAPYAFAVFLMSIYTRIDAVMIEQIADNGKYQSGLYAAGYRLLDAANMFAYLFAVLLLPMFTRLIAKRAETLSLMSQAFRLMWVLTIGTVVLCITYRSQIMSMYTESNQVWADTFGLLICSFISIGLMYVFGTYLTARGELKALNILYALCVALNIVLNFIFIPQSGALGAAWATLITQCFATTTLIALSIWWLRPKFETTYVLRFISFAIGAVLIAYSVSIGIERVSWWLQIVVVSLGILGLIFVSGVLKISEIKLLLTNRSGLQ